jgi:hypothetical protein
MFPLALLLAIPLSPQALAAKPFCGDGNAKGSEQCDGGDLDGQTCSTLGFSEGSLSCETDCTFDTSQCTSAGVTVCGDGVLEGYEECESTDDSACPG